MLSPVLAGVESLQGLAISQPQPAYGLSKLTLPALGLSLLLQCSAPPAATLFSSSTTGSHYINPLSVQITPSLPGIPRLLPVNRCLPFVDTRTIFCPFYLSVCLSQSLQLSILHHSNHSFWNSLSLPPLLPLFTRPPLPLHDCT